MLCPNNLRAFGNLQHVYAVVSGKAVFRNAPASVQGIPECYETDNSEFRMMNSELSYRLILPYKTSIVIRVGV